MNKHRLTGHAKPGFRRVAIIAGGSVLALGAALLPSAHADPVAVQTSDSITVVVDSKVKPHLKDVPGYERGVPRPVAGLVDSTGTQADFVANELVVTTADRTTLDAFVARWRGKILQSLTLDIPNWIPQHLVRIDTSRADPSKLSADLDKLNRPNTKAESMRVSSQDGLRLLAAGAAEGAAGISVAVNWVGQPQDIPNRSTAEAANGAGGFNNNPGTPYSRNAYNWSYLNSGSKQDIGVTEAWTLLNSVHRLDNKVAIGIVDEGFSPPANGDLPDLFEVSVVPFIGAEHKGFDVPWHGTDVASTAAGLIDNGKGAVGPAGRSATLNLVFSSYDYFTAIRGLAAALQAPARSRIINMSFTMPVPWPLFWTVLPFDLDTSLISTISGVLLIAAAGNAHRNVDARTCVPLIGFPCWESTWITPCENHGVLCVGGLALNDVTRDSDSNFGAEDVDIFAPFNQLAGPNPDALNDQARAVAGTSFAAPYTAGVAALIWAADPRLNANGVEQILRRNMRMSPDPNVGRRVINALSAVRDALPATIVVDAPSNGATLGAGQPTPLRATVYDDGKGVSSITWRLGNGLLLGMGNAISASLPPGSQEVTVTAVFGDGTSAVDRVRVSVVNHAPTVRIVSPRNVNGTPPTFVQNESISFRATSADPEVGPLLDSQVEWHFDGTARVFATGHNGTVIANAPVGPHTLTVRGCDAFNACAEDTVTFVITQGSPNQPPQVHITNPLNNARLPVNGSDANGSFHQLTLQSDVVDPEGDALNLVWTDSVGGQPPVVIGTGRNPTVKLRAACESLDHQITLTASDGTPGNERRDTVTVFVTIIC